VSFLAVFDSRNRHPPTKQVDTVNPPLAQIGYEPQKKLQIVLGNTFPMKVHSFQTYYPVARCARFIDIPPCGFLYAHSGLWSGFMNRPSFSFFKPRKEKPPIEACGGHLSGRGINVSFLHSREPQLSAIYCDQLNQIDEDSVHKVAHRMFSWNVFVPLAPSTRKKYNAAKVLHSICTSDIG